MIDDHTKTHSNNSDDFLERLQRYPQLRAKFEALLDVVENSSGDVVKGHEAEQRVFEELRQMGQDAVQAWAERKHQKLVSECDNSSTVSRKQKKLHWWSRFGKIEIHEQTYRRGRKGRLLRPFSKSADVTCRSYSLGLERALTDFGCDASFAKAAAKVKEHYRIDVPESGVRQATYKHAKTPNNKKSCKPDCPPKGSRK